MKTIPLKILICLSLALAARAEEKPAPDASLVYKTVGEVSLRVHIFNPPGHEASGETPAIVLFHGGAWQGGGYMQFCGQAAHLASRGMVAISVEYRTSKRHKTTPQECVKDAKSAMRWVRANAARLGIDPNRIAAGGGSAGGHLAAATALLEGYNEEGEDSSVSCLPSALVLFNPVVDNGPGGFGHRRVEAYWESFSPLHNIHDRAPPTIILTGSADTTFEVTSAKAYKERMDALGRRCDLLIYEDQPHAFFNRGNNEEMYYCTLLAADRFLVSLGYLHGDTPPLSDFIDLEAGDGE
jgi:acetyl esterase/lipase